MSAAGPHVNNGAGEVSSYASDDLVEMGRRELAGVNQGVQALDRRLSAPEPEQSIGGRKQRQGGEELVPVHVDFFSF